jgi:hypothetical protein
MYKLTDFDIDEPVQGSPSRTSFSRTTPVSGLSSTHHTHSSRDVERWTPLRSLYGIRGGVIVIDKSGMDVVPSKPIPAKTSNRKKGKRKSRAKRYSQQMRNFFLAKPGSSLGGSAYAPSTAFTSEISERPLGSEVTVSAKRLFCLGGYSLLCIVLFRCLEIISPSQSNRATSHATTQPDGIKPITITVPSAVPSDQSSMNIDHDNIVTRMNANK